MGKVGSLSARRQCGSRVLQYQHDGSAATPSFNTFTPVAIRFQMLLYRESTRIILCSVGNAHLVVSLYQQQALTFILALGADSCMTASERKATPEGIQLAVTAHQSLVELQ